MGTTRELSSSLPHGEAAGDGPPSHSDDRVKLRRACALLRVPLMVLLLLLNYFLAQYDKFVLSYFQVEVIQALNLTSTQYGLLSGYATGIVSALTAIPLAFVADYSGTRVWTLCAAALWWNVCVLLQGYSHNFWQIFLARLAMSIGQSPVEALSISLISDLVPTRWLFLAESVLYVGVYLGEAVSAQIATAFDKTKTPWNEALRAIGIVGMVLVVLMRLALREPERKRLIEPSESSVSRSESVRYESRALPLFLTSIKHIMRMKSFWILTLAAGARQFSGNVFGYYMPSYLSSQYPSDPNLLSHYGIIVGVVGSVAVVVGGLVCSSSPRIPTMALYISAIGGILSSAFVICMIFSKSLAGGAEEAGIRILYGTMSAAYLSAELWLGAFASLLALLLPPQMKTFCLAIYTCTIVLIYSSAPQIIGLVLRNYDVESKAYIRATRNALAILIPVGYWVAGIGFLFGVPQVRQDIASQRRLVVEAETISSPLGKQRVVAFALFIVALGSLTIALLVTSLVVN